MLFVLNINFFFFICVFTGRDSVPLNVCGDDNSDILSDSRSEHGTKEEDHILGFSTHTSDTAVPPSQTLSPCGTSSPLSGISVSSTSDSNRPRIWSLADVATSNGSGTNNSGTLPPSMVAPDHLRLGQLPSHLAPHGLQKMDPFNPAINGFRPWVNGSAPIYPGIPGSHPSSQTAVGSNTNNVSGSSTAASATGLLRPYALAPRTEVH